MRLGVLDIGTNSVRGVVYQVYSRSFRRLSRTKSVLRLGDEVFSSGLISESSTEKLIKVITKFKRDAIRGGVDEFVCVATSALREAKNSKSVIRSIHRSTGLKIRTISGEEEGKLILFGTMYQLKGVLGRRTWASVDIGGGSTEIGVIKDRDIVCCQSFPLGAARLSLEYLSRSFESGRPPSPVEIQKLRRIVRNELSSFFKHKDLPTVELIVGSSGTIRALAKVCGTANRRSMDNSLFPESMTKLLAMSPPQLTKIDGLKPWRVRYLQAGVIILDEITTYLEASRIITVKHALEDGLVATCLMK